MSTWADAQHHCHPGNVNENHGEKPLGVTDRSKYGQGWEASFMYCWWEWGMVQLLWKHFGNQTKSLLNMYLPTSHYNVFTQKLWKRISIQLWTGTFVAICSYCKCPSIHAWLYKLLYIYIMESWMKVCTYVNTFQFAYLQYVHFIICQLPGNHLLAFWCYRIYFHWKFI